MKRGCAVLVTSKSLAISRWVDEPAFVLHHYAWSESSLILETLTLNNGRIAMVAKGAKRPHSSLRSVLLPLQPLALSYSGDTEIRTLKSAEWVGGHVMPTGEALLSGFYINELMMHLLARDDPHPALFDIYKQTVEILASGLESATAPLLRTFELLLLRDTGFLPVLNAQTLTLQPLLDDTPYSLVPEGGLRTVHDEEKNTLTGLQWQQLHAVLCSDSPLTQTLRFCAELPSPDRSALQIQLRAMVNHHCGVSSLRTRQLMMELQSL